MYDLFVFAAKQMDEPRSRTGSTRRPTAIYLELIGDAWQEDFGIRYAGDNSYTPTIEERSSRRCVSIFCQLKWTIINYGQYST